MTLNQDIQLALEANVNAALAEDIGSGDITAQLIAENSVATGTIITREEAVICGLPWATQVFKQVETEINLSWEIEEGTLVSANQVICRFSGPSRGLLTAERTALNFLQTLSGTATQCRKYANSVAHTKVKLLDTRKTIPGLRRAQKYAVTQGGCHNHRIGLFDAFLIKENHITSCGSIAAAVEKARLIKKTAKVEVEVESIDELEQALSAGADIIMLDNFSIETTKEAITLTDGRALLEASGGITNETLVPIAETGVDYISIGALTKDCKAIDLSMRLND